jgi:5-formyltetrahydrofolate cyclo-ligase
MKSSEVKFYKSLLRNKLRVSLKRISNSDQRKKSAKITRRLIRFPFFRTARYVLVYAALPGEVQTQGLIKRALRLEKTIYLPRIHRTTGKMAIYQIKNWRDDLRKGTYGILEPKALPSRKGNVSQLDLIVVPGLGFDRKGRRLGRGGGFYDRFLAKSKNVKKIGLAFREQLLREIPSEAKDIRMDKVITD